MSNGDFFLDWTRSDRIANMRLLGYKRAYRKRKIKTKRRVKDYEERH